MTRSPKRRVVGRHQRAQVVELLKCAADVGGIEGAARWLGYGDDYDDKRYALAREAWYAVPIHATASYQWLCLEAAARLEEQP